jgi:hypothetical protein
MKGDAENTVLVNGEETVVYGPLHLKGGQYGPQRPPGRPLLRGRTRNVLKVGLSLTVMLSLKATKLP